MKRLVADPDIVAVIGEACSGATLAAAPLAEENHVVLISPASTNPEVSLAGEYIFRTAVGDAYQAHCAARLLSTEGVRKVAVLHGNEPYGNSYAAAMS